jgi:hypothetical protein
MVLGKLLCWDSLIRNTTAEPSINLYNMYCQIVARDLFLLITAIINNKCKLFATVWQQILYM